MSLFMFAFGMCGGLICVPQCSSRGYSRTAEDQSSCRKSASNQHGMAKRLQLRRAMCEVGLTPCCLLAFRHRLATQILNQKDKRGIPKVFQGRPLVPEYYPIRGTARILFYIIQWHESRALGAIRPRGRSYTVQSDLPTEQSQR